MNIRSTIIPTDKRYRRGWEFKHPSGFTRLNVAVRFEHRPLETTWEMDDADKPIMWIPLGAIAALTSGLRTILT